MPRSMDVCGSTCSASCPRHRSKSSATEQGLLQRTRLELLDRTPPSSIRHTTRAHQTCSQDARDDFNFTYSYHRKDGGGGVATLGPGLRRNRNQELGTDYEDILPASYRSIASPASIYESEARPASTHESEARPVSTMRSIASPASTHKTRLKEPANTTPSKFKPSSQDHAMIETFRNAVSALDSKKVNFMLEQSFEDVSIEEYSWLSELRKLGYSPREIGHELLEASQDGPWIFSEFEAVDSQPFSPSFHIENCLHSHIDESNRSGERRAISSQHFTSSIVTAETSGNSNRESIEYFCGIGGVSPMPTGARQPQFGSVIFKDSNSTAIVSLKSMSGNGANSSVRDVLAHLERAIGVLQRIGGCCDSFTFLSRNDDLLELHRLDLSLVRNFFHDEAPESTDTSIENTQNMAVFVSKLFAKESHELLSPPLIAQFLCLAFLSYSQAHCGPIRPFFMDTHLHRIILIGDNEWHEKIQGPYIVGSLMNLSCFGDMLREPVFTFQYHHGPDGVTTLLEPDLKFDLFAEPEDILDTWGPGELITSRDDATNLHAISIGSGYVVPCPAEAEDTCNKLHWSNASKISALTTTTFPRGEKAVIGANISSTVNCNGKPHVQIRKAAFSLLTNLDTFPGYWEVSERQIGLGIQGGGPSVGFLQFNQTWVKRKGLTKKSKLLAQKSLYIPDLEALFGIQISVCTGIARRVRLRDLLAELIPTYVADQIIKHPLWESLFADFGLITALKNDNLSAWSKTLSYEHQKTFTDLVFAVLFVLQDTGVDRDGETFVVGCIQPGIPDQCIRIPCKDENCWARIVADSEDHATFVYMTTECLETDHVKCHGPRSSWLNSTAFLCTAVSCCYDRQAASGASAVIPEPWTLKNSESYLIGRVDAPLIVDVERLNAQAEPRLLVSLSRIRPDILNRLYRRGRYGKPRRLREKRMVDQIAESVVVAANLK